MAKAFLLTGLADISAHGFFEYLRERNGTLSFGYCPAGGITLAEALGKVIREKGGDIWTGSPVTALVVEKGMVQGAIVQNEQKRFHFTVSAIISDIGPRQTAQLTGLDHFARDYLQEMDRTLKPTAVMAIQLALDESLLDGPHLVVCDGKRISAIHQPTTICPELAPAGKHLLVVYATPQTIGGGWDGTREIESCRQELAQLFPGLQQISQLLMAGVFHGDWPGMRVRPGGGMPNKTSLINLYNVGDGIHSTACGGLSAAVESGRATAQDIMGRIGLIRTQVPRRYAGR